MEEEQKRLAEELRIEEAHEERRRENEQLARGEAIDLSGRSAESLQEDQLNTIRDILGGLGEATETKVDKV